MAGRRGRGRERRCGESREGELPFPWGWGGWRPGAGRKPSGKAGVPHGTRPVHKARHPLHVTVRVRRGLPSLRGRRELAVLRVALAGGAERFGFRLVHFSVQRDHLHLVAEAKDRVALTRGMKGLGVRIAKRLNRAWGRRGKVVCDRYHARVLRTPREVRNALAYVLRNAQHHGVHRGPFDPASSAAWFDGWRADARALAAAAARAGPAFVAAARTWLLCVGWRRHGRIRVVAALR